MTEQTQQVPTSDVAKGKKESKFSMSSILKDIAEFKGWEKIFQVALYAFICWGIYALYLTYNFHHDPYFADVPKFSIYDFKLAAIPTLIFFVYKHLCLKFFTPWLKTKMDPAKYPTEEDREARAQKGAVWLMNVLYYSFTSILSYILFNDTFFFPTYLGGNAQCSDIYKYTPIVPDFPYGVLFYQIQFGWHFHTLIDYIATKWHEPKFWEMFLHHCVAVFLIFFSYLTNQVPVGILVLTTHDPSDIGLCGSRLYNDFKNKSVPALFVIYFGFVASWMYFRLFVFPKCVVGTALISLFNYEKDAMYHLYLYMIFMMSALVILHIYWFTYIMRIVLGMIGNKKEFNIYDKKKAH